jgi:O-antigen/teichoic acid export membrane protein
MRSSRFWRRSSTAAGVYGAAVLGFAGTLVAARELGPARFGAFALAVTAAGFVQSLLDLTFEEAFVKFGFGYVAQERWGRLRRLVRVGFAVKLAGAALGTLVLLALAPFADAVFHDSHGLTTPFLVAAALPLAQAPETVAAAALTLCLRYDIRAGFLAFSAALRLVGLAAGASFGVTGAVLGMLAAQAVGAAAVSVAGFLALRRFPQEPPEPLGEDRRGLVRFVAQSSIGTGILSLRGVALPTLLGLVSSPTQVGYFRVAQMPQTAFAALSSPIRMVFLAEQTNAVEQGRLSQLYRALWRYMAASAVAMAVVVPVLLVAMPDLLGLVRSDYRPAADAARLVLLAAALELVWGWTKWYPISIGRPLLRILAHTVEAAVIVPLVLVFGARWGATGAAAAALVGMGAFCIWWSAVIVWARGSRTLAAPAASS